MNLYQQERAERRTWFFANILLLLAALLIALALNGCHPYEVAKRRYATNVVDTTYTTITTVVPRDSVRLVIKTDTTRVIEKVRQGRATVTIIREPKNTTVIANCDSVRKEQKVVTKVVKQVWGVDPKYKDQMQSWRVATVVLGVLFLIGIGAYLLTYRFKLNLDLDKRDRTAR